MSTDSKSAYAIPAAIIVAGLIVAGAVFLTKAPAGAPTAANPSAKPAAGDLKAMAPVTDADYIRGSKDAKVVVVEYSDIDCPFCQRFHPTLATLKAEYGDDLAWVYRHYPLSIHPNAETKAVATECVGKLGGDDAFWKFLDAVVGETSANRSDLTRLATHAVAAGVDKDKFLSCWNGKETLPAIKATMTNANAIGVRGTPFTVVLGKNGKVTSVSGAQSVDAVRAAIDSVK